MNFGFKISSDSELTLEQVQMLNKIIKSKVSTKYAFQPKLVFEGSATDMKRYGWQYISQYDKFPDAKEFLIHCDTVSEEIIDEFPRYQMKYMTILLK